MQMPHLTDSQQAEQSAPAPEFPLSDRLMGMSVACAVAALVVLLGHFTGAQLSLEARRRAWVVGDLVSGVPRGSEGLVGSLGLSPLPTLAMALLSLVPFAGPDPLLGCVVAAASGAALAAYLDARWAAHGMRRWARYLSMGCLLFLPPVAAGIQSGTSTLLFVALAVCGWGFMTSWIKNGNFRHLACSAVLLGLSVAVRHQAVSLVVAAALLVAIAAAAAGRRWSTVEGTALVFLLPAGGVLLLWLAGNWLAMGNPVFFLKAPFRALTQETVELGYVLAGGCEWLTLAAVAPAVLSVPVAHGLVRRPDRRAGEMAALGGIAIALLVIFGADITTNVELPEPHIGRVVKRLESRYSTAIFIVTGYKGYEFTRAATPEARSRWVHLMHLDPDKLDRILEANPDRQVYVLVRGDDDIDRWHYVGLEWRQLHSRIPEQFIFAREIGPWVLFECVRQQNETAHGPPAPYADALRGPAAAPSEITSKSRSNSS